MAKNDAALMAALNDLLQLDHDAVASYQVAIDAVSTETLKRKLRQFKRDHQRHVAEIGELVRARGGTPVTAPHLSTGMLKLAVQALGAAGGDRAVLLAFRTNEWESANKYARAAGRRFPPEVREVIRRGAEDEAKHYRWAVDSLEKLGAGDTTVLGRVEQVMERLHGGAALGLEAVERLVASTRATVAARREAGAKKTPRKRSASGGTGAAKKSGGARKNTSGAAKKSTSDGAKKSSSGARKSTSSAAKKSSGGAKKSTRSSGSSS
ncbi:MAG TPA: ferritin-like domain-containing protein [Longimicrobium sp.]|jgi:rubrerythrin